MSNNVSYLNKTFSEFKSNLINYAKTYFPNVYNNFSDANPGGLFIDMAAYVGDVTSFYLDTQTQENFLLYAKERENLFALSYMLGYRPKISYASNTTIDIFQLIPSTQDAFGNLVPDYGYALIVPANTTVTSNTNGIRFLTVDEVDFSNTSNTTVSFVDRDYFLLKKQVKVISATLKSITLPFSTPQKFSIANIIDTNILQILDATDSQGNKWYEVPYLAQSYIFDKVSNPNVNTDNTPYLLQLRRIPRRFVSRFLSDNTMQLEFGAGLSSNISDNKILPDPDNINLGLVPGISNLYNNFNKTSLFYAQEYGLAPTSDITVRYLVGGGVEANVPANSLTIIDQTTSRFKGTPFNPSLENFIRQSLVSNNSAVASGGRGGDQVEEIRNNALFAYQSQLRAVTRGDYMIRALSLPSEYGSIAKVYVTQDMVREELLPTPTVSTTEGRNPLSLDMYILGYNADKKLTTTSTTLKQNLATYINEFRMVTDAINIKDAFYINIGVNFDVVVASGFSNNDVLTDCILNLKDHFSIEKWNINQPIVLSDITALLLRINGVQTVTKVEIINKQGGNYSPYSYDIPGATRQGNIYPSLDPCVFEVRFPDIDIQGRVVPFVI